MRKGNFKFGINTHANLLHFYFWIGFGAFISTIFQWFHHRTTVRSLWTLQGTWITTWYQWGLLLKQLVWLTIVLKRGHLRHTFVYFWSFHNFCNIFFKKVFLELGVEITTSWTRVSSHYHYNKPLGEHCLYLHTMIPKPLFGCVKKLAVAQMAKLLLTAQEIRGWIYQCNCQ